MLLVLVDMVDMVEVDGREAESGFAESLRRQLGVIVSIKLDIDGDGGNFNIDEWLESMW